MAIGVRAWLLRRDPGLLAVRRAGRVAVVACMGFYVCYYLLNQPVMATYALFAAVAMGVLSQIPGPGTHRCRVLLRALPVALALVTAGTLLAGNVWAATSGVLVFGFVIAYSGVGSPTLSGLATGMQLFFILACFPPYASDTLGARLLGVCLGMGLLGLAELTLWPDRDEVSYASLLAGASSGLAEHLAARAAGTTLGSAGMGNLPDWPPEGLWPSSLPPGARPTSASRRDQALRDAGGALSFALARLRPMPSATPPSAVELLDTAAHAARSTAEALRGGQPPRTRELTGALQSGGRRGSELTIAVAGVWTMATAVRIALGAPIESGQADRRVHRQRFPYAYASTVGLWWQRYRTHLTVRSVYFQAAVRVAVALAAARLVAGSLDLSHGFWVLLATLSLLRSRAADTRSALRPAVVGTVAGAAVVGVLLVTVGARPDVYAAITPPIMVVAFAAGAIVGPTWGQALFTVLVTLVFTQLSPAGAEIAGIRVVDVLVGAATGIMAGLFTWPRGAAGELRRSAARFLAACGHAVEATAQVLTAPQPVPSHTAVTATATSRVGKTMALADAAYTLYQNEHHRPPESTVDWPAVITAGHHMVRGADLVLDLYAPGSLAQWRSWVTDSATKVDAACNGVAESLRDHRRPRAAPPVLEPAPDAGELGNLQAWLVAVADDLTRLTAVAPMSGDP